MHTPCLSVLGRRVADQETLQPGHTLCGYLTPKLSVFFLLFSSCAAWGVIVQLESHCDFIDDQIPEPVFNITSGRRLACCLLAAIGPDFAGVTAGL